MLSLVLLYTSSWDNFLITAAFFGIILGANSFLYREKIRDKIQEMGGETISISAKFGFRSRYSPHYYYIIYKDKKGRTISAECNLYLFGDVDIYNGKVIEDITQKKSDEAIHKKD